MPVTVEWYDKEETIGYWQFIGPWTAQEFLYHMRVAVEEGEKKAHPIAVILDFTRSHPNTRHILTTFRNGDHMSARNLALIVVVGGPLAISIANIFDQFNRKRTHPILGVPSLNQALALIDAHFKTARTS